MKQLLLIVFLVVMLNNCTMGQNDSEGGMSIEVLCCLAEAGKDSNPSLNDCESKYLNYKFQDRRGDFDFSGKKVAFFKGNTGKIWASKEWYFEQLKGAAEIYGYVPLDGKSVQLRILNEKEAQLTGYDAVIFCGSKKYISKQEAINRLKNK